MVGSVGVASACATTRSGDSPFVSSLARAYHQFRLPHRGNRLTRTTSGFAFFDDIRGELRSVAADILRRVDISGRDEQDVALTTISLDPASARAGPALPGAARLPCLPMMQPWMNIMIARPSWLGSVKRYPLDSARA